MTTAQPQTQADLMDGVLQADYPFAEALERAERRTRLDDSHFLPRPLTEQDVHRRAVLAVTSQAAKAGRRVSLHVAMDGSTAYQHDVGSRIVADLIGTPMTRSIVVVGSVPGTDIALDQGSLGILVVPVSKILDVQVLDGPAR